jgi:hypothetical protein
VKCTVSHLFIINIIRWDEKCLIICPENYEKKMDEKRGEYVCIRKKCEDRIPFKNKSCSLREDFIWSEENCEDGDTGCYYTDSGDDINEIDDDWRDVGRGRCVMKEECPSDYPGV